MENIFDFLYKYKFKFNINFLESNGGEIIVSDPDNRLNLCKEILLKCLKITSSNGYKYLTLNEEEIFLLECKFEFFKFKEKNIYIEYGSINPNGRIHLGHFRNLSIGYFITNLYKFLGVNVYSEYLVNDMGGQIESLNIDGYYEDTKNIYKITNKSQTNVRLILNSNKNYLFDFGIKFDNFVFESKLRKGDLGIIKEIVKDNDNKKFFLFDNKKVFLTKENNNFCYIATDLFFLGYKKKLCFDKFIMLLGYDQKSAADVLESATTYYGMNCIYLIYQNVTWDKMSLSKRKSNLIFPEEYNLSLSELIFLFLSKKNLKPICLEENMILENKKYFKNFLNKLSNNFNSDYKSKKMIVLWCYKFNIILGIAIKNLDFAFLFEHIKDLIKIKYINSSSLFTRFIWPFLSNCLAI